MVTKKPGILQFRLIKHRKTWNLRNFEKKLEF